MTTRPFFTLVHDLLDRKGEVRLGELVDSAGVQVYGLLVLLLALPSLVPGLNLGAAPVGGFAIMAVGLQMARGVPKPWIPGPLRNHVLHRGRIKEVLTRLERHLSRFSNPRSSRKPISGVWMGLGVGWTGFLLAIPVPLPFGNILPAAVLCLFGTAILEEHQPLARLATAACLANTIYFGLSFDLIFRAIRTLIRWM